MKHGSGKHRVRGPALACAVAGLLGLWPAGCSRPPENAGPGEYQELVLVTPSAAAPVTISGDSAYYYVPQFFHKPLYQSVSDSNYDYYRGVFVAGRTVQLSPFYMAKYETTYALWYTVYQWAKGRGYTFANAGREGHDGAEGAAPTTARYRPVTAVNWRDVVIWCNAYSEMTGKQPVYYTNTTYATILKTSTNDGAVNTAADYAVMRTAANGYRLPTEAEWEYAARGGGDPALTGPFVYNWAGTDIENRLANYAWYSVNSGDAAHQVGERTANELGLYDMSGNVYEWCWDGYGTAPAGTALNPTGTLSGSLRVIRGGSWVIYASGCAVAGRDCDYPYRKNNDRGFRVVTLSP